MTRFYIQPAGSRPEFRLVISFLWGDFHNVDTDGDSSNPASRDWTELYCKNRQAEDQIFEVHAIQTEPLVLEVESRFPWLAARVAYFLAVETGSGFSTCPAGPFDDPESLRQLGGDFDWVAAKQRAAASCWRRSTLENPYPNLHP